MSWATFVSRVTKFAKSKFGDEIPSRRANSARKETALIADLGASGLRDYTSALDGPDGGPQGRRLNSAPSG